MKEAAELRDPTEHYHAQPLEVSSPHTTTVLQYLYQITLAAKVHHNTTTSQSVYLMEHPWQNRHFFVWGNSASKILVLTQQLLSQVLYITYYDNTVCYNNTVLTKVMRFGNMVT